MSTHRASISAFSLVLVVVMLLTIVAALMPTAAYAATSDDIQAEIDDLNDQKNDIQDQMEDIQSAIDGLDYEMANILEKKAILDQKNLLAQEELDVIQEQIDIVDGLISNMQADLAAAQAEEEYQRERWLTRVRAMEESSTVDYMQVLFNATSFSDLLTRLDLINEIMAYDEALEQEYIEARENVAALEAEAEEMYIENEANRAELESKKAQLETDMDAAAQLMVSLEDNISDYELMMEQAEAFEKELVALISEKEEELAEALAAEEAARQAALAAQQAQQGSSSVSAGTNAAGFIWPSYTKLITSPFGYRIHPISGVWSGHKGVDIGASYGTAAWAAAGGTVITASYGWNGGYGNYVVVSHSNGYSTLYAHLSSIAVSSGQSVSQGQTVGYVGSTGNSTGPHLHFEVRSNGTPVDPLGFAYP